MLCASEDALESMSSSDAPRRLQRWGGLALLSPQQRCRGLSGLYKATQLDAKELHLMPP